MRHLKKTIPVLVSAVLLVSAVMAHGLSAEAAKKDADGNPVKDADGKEIWTADAGVLDKD